MPSKEKELVRELPIDITEDTTYIIDQQSPNSYTHNYFKYPCKFIPEIPKWAIKTYLKEPSKDKVIMDPFAGSGTTLLEGSLAGAKAVGAEIDEIAKLIIKVKTTKLSCKQVASVKTFTSEVLRRLELKSYGNNDIIYPKINNLGHWFRNDILDDLGHLYYSIKQITDEQVKNYLLICMASIIKKVSNADDISPKPYVSNNIVKNPPAVGKIFGDTVAKYLIGMNELQGKELSDVEVKGDATHLEAEDNSVDLAITSPPYINAFDYVRTLRLENLWLELATEDELREKKKRYLGTESIRTKEELLNLDILQESKLLECYYNQINEVDRKRALITKKFFEDMKKNLQEVHRVLKPGGEYVIVIGNSFIRKVNVESWRVLKELAVNVGFKYVSHIAYEIQNPYIRISRGNKGGKIAIDHILVIRK